jgi:hypothetical protein
MSCREALAAAQNDVGSMRAAQLGDRERLEAALETEAALRREVTQLAASREQLEAALAQGLDRADFFVECCYLLLCCVPTLMALFLLL